MAKASTHKSAKKAAKKPAKKPGAAPKAHAATAPAGKVRVTDVILRDAHQSLLATRMRTEDMLPVCDKLDRVGYWSLEAWGGATFDACLRFLKEDPWERLRKLKQALELTQQRKWYMPWSGKNLYHPLKWDQDVANLRELYLSGNRSTNPSALEGRHA